MPTIRRPTRRQVFIVSIILLSGYLIHTFHPLIYPLKCLALNWLAPEPTVLLSPEVLRMLQFSLPARQILR